VDTKNISFLLRFLFNMFWLFFGLLPSCTIMKQLGDFASLTSLSPLFCDQTF